jgi:hypothetical protein
MLVKPMSLPPICSVTICVSDASALTSRRCGPRVTSWAPSVAVVAPLQEASASAAEYRGGQMGEVVVRAQAAQRVELLVEDQRPAARESPRPAQLAAERLRAA